MSSITTKSPDTLRRERAAAEFPAMRFQLATVKFRDRETGQPCGALGICYVFSPSGETYTVTLKNCRPTGCDCADHRRRGGKCKHMYALELHLGEAPEPAPAPEPVEEPAPALTPMQRWSGRVLETPEERDARITKDRELWD